MSFNLNVFLLLLRAVYIQGKYMAARQDYDEARKPKNYQYNADEEDNIGPRQYSQNGNFGNGNSGNANYGSYGGWCVCTFYV